MPRLVQFVLALVTSLALLAWVVTGFVEATASRWFERDVSLRARLVVMGARTSLAAHWSPDQRIGLERQLSEIARDERVMAAAACNADFSMLASTADFQELFNCRDVGLQMRASRDAAAPLAEWTTVSRLPAGSIHVSAVPLWDGGRQIGFVIVLQDLSYAERREASTRNFLLLSFGILGLLAAALTILVARLSRRRWSTELRAVLQGENPQRPEFLLLRHALNQSGN